MTGRLFRFTPHGGKPNHYTDSYRSASAQMEDPAGLAELDVGDKLELLDGSTVERVA